MRALHAEGVGGALASNGCLLRLGKSRGIPRTRNDHPTAASADFHTLTVDYTYDTITVMKTVNALELRQSLGRVLRALEKGGEPILVERQRRAAAVLISLHDYKTRFADRDADEQRKAVIRRIRELQFEAPKGKTTTKLLRDLRS